MPAAHLIRHAVEGLAMIRPVPLAEHPLPDMDHLVRHRCNQRAELLVLPAGHMNAELPILSPGDAKEVIASSNTELYIVRVRKFPAPEGRRRPKKLKDSFNHRGGDVKTGHVDYGLLTCHQRARNHIETDIETIARSLIGVNPNNLST